MNFVHLWAIGIGSFALVAPLAVHWLTRPKPTSFPLSTVRFLQEVIQQRRARSRLRDWIVLALRMLCIALLAATIARPLWQRPPVVTPDATSETQRVLVIDSSLSMAAGGSGVTSWSTATASALEYLDSSATLQANVIFAGARARPVFDQLSPNLGALREAVKQARPQAERCDPRLALEAAAKMLGQGDSGRKELVLISDFQRSNWGTMLLDLVPKDTQIQFHNAGQSAGDNMAITSVRFTSEPIAGQPAILEVEVSNTTARPIDVRCAIEIGPVKRTLTGSVLPAGAKTLVESITLDEIGWTYGSARLENNLDVLADDDSRPLAIRVRAPLRVLMVSRQNASEFPSSSYYVEQALNVALGQSTDESASDEKTSQRPAVARVHPTRDPLRNWPECDIIVLEHPGALAPDMIAHLATSLRRGQGILYVTSELVDAMNLKQLSELLGGQFQPPVELLPGDASAGRKDLFVRSVKSREPPFSVLGSTNAASLFKSVRFQGGLNTRATAEGLRDQILAELSDTSALLYVSSIGAGQLAVLNADLARSNWTREPTFLPVMSELTSTLLSSDALTGRTHCGEPLVRLLGSEVKSDAKLKPHALLGPLPTDGFGNWQWEPSQNSIVWNWAEPAGAGVYALEQDGKPVAVVATAAPAIESDLSTLDEKIITERVSGQREVGYVSAASTENSGDALWNWLIVACLCGLIGEVLTLRLSRM